MKSPRKTPEIHTSNLEPLTLPHLPSSFSLRSAISHLPSSIFHLPSAIIPHPSSIFHQPSSIFHLPSSIIPHPSAVRPLKIYPLPNIGPSIRFLMIAHERFFSRCVQLPTLHIACHRAVPSGYPSSSMCPPFCCTFMNL